MPETPCYELVIYRLKPETEPLQWQKLHQHIINQLAAQPGYMATETDHLKGDTLTLCDHVYWESLETAQAGDEAFQNLNGVEAMMALVDEVIFSGTFEAK